MLLKIGLLFRLAVGLFALRALAGCTALPQFGFGECPGDASIRAVVEARFTRHAALEPPNLLRVQTYDQIVYLYGLVDTALERDLAESIARDTPGVKKVVNSIGISGNR